MNNLVFCINIRQKQSIDSLFLQQTKKKTVQEREDRDSEPVKNKNVNERCKKLCISKFSDYNSKIKTMQAEQIIHALSQPNLHEMQSIMEQPVEFSCRFKIMIQSQNSVKNITMQSLFQIRGNYLTQFDQMTNQIVSAKKLAFDIKIKLVSALDCQNETVTSNPSQFLAQFVLEDVLMYDCPRKSNYNQKDKNRVSLYFCGIDQKMGEVFLGRLLQKSVLQEVSDLRAHFRPGKIIGTGNLCRIYEASQLSSKKKVAIKSYSKQIFQRQNSFIETKNQLTLLHSLKNKSILNPLKIYCTQNSLYIVTEICETTLQNLLAYSKHVKWSASLAQRIYCKLLNVVHYLHANRITHGNICLDNILVRNQSSQNLELFLIGFSKFQCFADQVQLDHNPEREQMNQLCSQNQCRQQAIRRSEDVAALGQIFEKILHKVIESNLTRASMQVTTENKGQQNVIDEGIKQAKYLLQKMTTAQEEERVDAQQALNHPFFTMNFDS